jgi:hypothetical protein
MRLILGAASVLLAGALSACAGTDDSGANDKKAETTSPQRFVACDLLTQEQRDTAAGTTIDYPGGEDFYFPEWTCEFGDAPGQVSENRLIYTAMPAEVWAEKLPYIIDTTPADQKPRKFLTAVLKRAGLSEDELPQIDGDGGCHLWTAYQDVLGTSIVDDTITWSDTDHDIDTEFAHATTCSDGVFADVSIHGSDADSRAGRSRAGVTLATVHENAVKTLPR